ncbi:D-alanyl-D-alanine carboxypeptidase family protein [Streptomyces leeuwenhoekii]|uniref:D-alanyl-D-alanine carboxypeptidase dacF n=1 Tax=Streptomyces leeuwenhoekii TaxID=1437453 RepID=A0A0F7VZ27_STRLW|nr:serine hydrolase [Streptomyces leeuwenhoekii]CQR65784.1 D-alanyl-D-alanine carboxypeptidase dacF [Streptomyces leeuwenhoekii]
MNVGFPSRVAASSCALCVAGLLVLAPAAPAARTRPPDPGTPAGPGTTGPPPSLLHRSGTQVRPRPGTPGPPVVSAVSWVVADALTGEVLAAHDAHRRLPPASTLKTLFALAVLPVLPGGIRHTVREEELAGIGPGSSLVGVAEDRAYRVTDLWHGVFLGSGNDAVRVLSALSGGRRDTIARMHAKARDLGAHDTRVLSPDGYDEPGQVSSAYDLAVFGRAGLRNPDFARYCATVDAYFPGRDGGTYGIRNTNRLLTGTDGVRPYPGLIGVKNGYTAGAGNTLVAAARRQARTVVVSVMNPRTGGASAVYEEARALLDWGFRAAGRVDPVGSLDALRARPPAGPGPVSEAAPPASARPVGDGPGWPEAGAVAGAAGLGAGAVVLLLRLAGSRIEWE